MKVHMTFNGAGNRSTGLVARGESQVLKGSTAEAVVKLESWLVWSMMFTGVLKKRPLFFRVERWVSATANSS
jgi:hypothetical protein